MEELQMFAPFSAARPETVKSISESAVFYDLGPGEQIECGNALGLVLHGDIIVRGLNGARKMIYRTIGRGEVFGAAQLFGGDCAFTQLTAKNDCRIAVIPEEAVTKAITGDGEFALSFTETLCEKLRILNRKLSMLSSSGATAAVCRMLLDTAKDGEMFRMSSKEEFAARAGISRMTLYRILGTIENSGAIIIKEKYIIIKNRELLKSMT